MYVPNDFICTIAAGSRHYSSDTIVGSPQYILIVNRVRSSFSQSVKVDLGTDVLERGRHHARHDVVVVPAPEVLVLEGGAVVYLVVENLRHLSVKHPVGGISRGVV